jgi:hypothetical protein
LAQASASSAVNFALDDQVRQPDENPSIGIILCQSRNRLKVEYALRGMTRPMGVAEYYLTRQLPPELAEARS